MRAELNYKDKPGFDLLYDGTVLSEAQLNGIIDRIHNEKRFDKKGFLSSLLIACESRDPKQYGEYLKFGCSRTIVLNYKTYCQSLMFGGSLDNLSFNDYGWVKESNYLLSDQAEIKINDNAKIRIKESINGLFVGSFCFDFSTHGSHSSPSIWGNTFTSFNACKNQMLTELKTRIESSLKGESVTSVQLKMTQTIDALMKYETSCMQYSLF